MFPQVHVPTREEWNGGGVTAGFVAAAERMAAAVWKGPLLLKAMTRIISSLAAICVRLQVQEGFRAGPAAWGPLGPLLPFGNLHGPAHKPSVRPHPRALRPSLEPGAGLIWNLA